jgi:hypothetical protein
VIVVVVIMTGRCVVGGMVIYVTDRTGQYRRARYSTVNDSAVQ